MEMDGVGRCCLLVSRSGTATPNLPCLPGFLPFLNVKFRESTTETVNGKGRFHSRKCPSSSSGPSTDFRQNTVRRLCS